MELRHLRYFAALAEQLNFTRAAEQVHVTQSTLSHQIKQLEDEIGHRLFDRIGKRVVITDAGEILLANVTKALRQIDDGLKAIKGSAEQLTGTLRIGATHTFNMSLIPSCVGSILEAHPSVSVTVDELPAAAIERQLLSESIDVGIAYRPSEAQRLVFEPLFMDEMVLAVPDGHPLAARRRMRMADLHRQRLVLSAKESATRKMLDACFESASAEPVVVAEMNSLLPALALARRMNAATIISPLALPDIDGIQIVALENPIPVRTPGVLWKRGKRKLAAAQSFVAIVRLAVVKAKMKPPR